MAETITLSAVMITATSAIIGANAYIVRLVVQNAVKDSVLKTLKDIDKAIDRHEANCPALKRFLHHTTDK